MLTPRFEISQTDAELIFIIHAPYANIKEAVVHVEKNDFRFYATPYYLRLSLPGDIKETDSSKGSYDCEKGEFRLVFSKVNEGEHFENLDMITTLLAPARKRNTVPTIEVISNPCSNENEASGTQEASDDENIMTPDGGDEWYIDQNIEKEKKVILQNSPRYGFANKITKALNNFEDSWIKEIIDLPQPDETSEVDRKTLKEQQERSDFSADHYTADLMEDDVVEPYLTYEWETIVASDVKFNGEEMDILKELPNKEYLLDAEEIDAALYSMVDILFAHCYNRRVTLGDNNVVSGWTINKLSSTLSWFQIFSSIDDVISSGVRRSLCYPQVRNWNLALVVLEDLKKVLKLGKMYIIKQFCEIYTLFNNSPEPRYILNQLYIKDYLIWLQQISCSKIEEMENRVKNIQVEKATMGLNLEMIEAAAYNTLNDLIIENNLDELQNGMDKLALGQVKESKNNSDSDSADSESDSSSSSGDSSSCTDSDSDSSDSDSNSDSDSESESESEISKNNEIVYSNKSHSIPKLQNSSSSELDSDDDPN